MENFVRGEKYMYQLTEKEKKYIKVIIQEWETLCDELCDEKFDYEIFKLVASQTFNT